MELRRFFVSPSDVGEDIVTVRGDEFSHMTRVLRMKPGFKAIVCADDGKERYCTLREIGDGYAVLSVDEARDADRKKVSLTLYCGVLKNSKLDLVVQKAVRYIFDFRYQNGYSDDTLVSGMGYSGGSMKNAQRIICQRGIPPSPENFALIESRLHTIAS